MTRRTLASVGGQKRASSRPRRVLPRARRELGQHFLIDGGILARIAAATEAAPGTSILEIGAGSGQLTEALLATGATIAAVELDEALCRYLRARFAAEARVRTVCASVLHHPPEQLLAEAGLTPPYTVAGNIPYYITAPILRTLLEAQTPPRRLGLTVQKEVAESITATPGAMSLLAVSVQFYARPQLLFEIPRQAFRPQPRVDSAVIRIDVAREPRISVEDRERFFQLVRAGFRSPRKQLHNTLSLGLWMPSGASGALLRDAGIDPMRRAQSLSLEEWQSLYLAYEQRRLMWQDQQPDNASTQAASDDESQDNDDRKPG